jgi:hypothetical protein
MNIRSEKLVLLQPTRKVGVVVGKAGVVEEKLQLRS